MKLNCRFASGSEFKLIEQPWLEIAEMIGTWRNLFAGKGTLVIVGNRSPD